MLGKGIQLQNLWLLGTYMQLCLVKSVFHFCTNICFYLCSSYNAVLWTKPCTITSLNCLPCF